MKKMIKLTKSENATKNFRVVFFSFIYFSLHDISIFLGVFGIEKGRNDLVQKF